MLGYSALKTGLLLAPCSVVSMVVAPGAGRLSDRIGGKRILMFGLVVYALGLTWLSLVLGLDPHWTVFLAPMLVAGLGTGCMFAPMATEAMREIPPALAGSASGVNNTVRQIGSVLGGTVAGAILQNRMAAELRAGALERSGELPEPLREGFVAGLSRAAAGGLELGADHQTAAGDAPPQVRALAEEVFGTALINAVRPTQAFAIVAVLMGAAACLLVRAPQKEALSTGVPASDRDPG